MSRMAEARVDTAQTETAMTDLDGIDPPSEDDRGDDERGTGVSYQLWKMADRVLQAVRSDGRDEAGASLVEYALLVALIAVVCIVAVSVLGSNASAKFSTVGSAIR